MHERLVQLSLQHEKCSQAERFPFSTNCPPDTSSADPMSLRQKYRLEFVTDFHHHDPEEYVKKGTKLKREMRKRLLEKERRRWREHWINQSMRGISISPLAHTAHIQPNKIQAFQKILAFQTFTART